MQITWTPGEPVWLESPNYVARSLRPDDVSDRFVSWFSDAETMRYVRMPPAGKGRGQIADYVNLFDNRATFFLGLFYKHTGQLIGFRQIIFHPEDGDALLTLVIGEKDFQNKGINREFRATFYEFLFVTLGVRKMTAEILGGNVRSHRLAIATGYKLEKTLPKHHVTSDGVRRDVSIYGMRELDWRAKRQFLWLPIWRAALFGDSKGQAEGHRFAVERLHGRVLEERPANQRDRDVKAGKAQRARRS